jgi:hypothetical protein
MSLTNSFSPVNYIQLSGNISNIQKNITIVLDKHFDLDNQTRCDSFDSIDISQYLYKLIKNAIEPLDFFLEIRDNQLIEPIRDKRDIYIKDVMEMFKTEFLLNGDKVKYSKSNPNVRLHYLDIRDHLGIFYLTRLIHYDILPIIESLKNNTSNDNDKLKQTKILTEYIEKIQKHIKKLIKNKQFIQKSESQQFDEKSQEYYLNKIIHKYNQQTLKNNLNIFLNMNISTYKNQINNILANIVDNIFSYDMDLKNNFYLDEMIKSFNELNIVILKLYTLFTDIYFLRRILDKDYIQNVITYCGNHHGLDYMFFLVKYCDFKIIKIYNSNNMSIDTIINKFEDINYVQEVYIMFSLEKEKIKQCVDFPIDEIIVM